MSDDKISVSSAPDAVADALSAPAVSWQQLWQRWFIQYNPMYVVSAACMLTGVYFVSEGLSRQEDAWAQLSITGIAELYQLLLIAGAGILYRIEQKRPAVMLGMLQVFFFADLTFENGAAAFLGWSGLVSSTLWIALTLAKLRLLCFSLKLRLHRFGWFAFSLGTVVVAVLPHLLQWGVLPRETVAALLGLVGFAIGLLHRLCQADSITSRVPLSAWGMTVLRRARRATWLIWASLTLGHMLWWSLEFAAPCLSVFLSVVLVAASYFRRELSVWTVVCTVLLVVGYAQPSAFWATALMGAFVFVLHGLRGTILVTESASATQELPHPYRLPPALTRALHQLPGPMRLQVAAISCAYLGFWTLTWSGGAWPGHRLWLDLLFAAALFGAGWQGKIWFSPVVAALAAALHLALQQGWLKAPGNLVNWGAWLLCLGFGLLLGGVAVNWYFKGWTEKHQQT